MAASVVSVLHNGRPVPPWTETAKEFLVMQRFPHLRRRLEEGLHCLSRSERTRLGLLADQRRAEVEACPPNPTAQLHEWVSLLAGENLAHVSCDAIVNASNHRLTSGKGLNGSIHAAAGPCLLEECLSLGGCEVGQAKLSSGHTLHTHYVLHTVGPERKDSDRAQMLRSCYESCLSLCLEYGVRTVAFPCISTGAYGYPSVEAADIALSTVRRWLLTDSHWQSVDRVVFVTRRPKDEEAYGTLMLALFPQV